MLLGLAGLGILALVGPFGFGGGFNKVAGSNTYGPVSPVEALGIWPASNYRLDAVGGAPLTGLAGAIAALALALGTAWWVRRRDLPVPIALGACAVLYLVSLPFSGDYSQAKALMIAAPLAMLVAIRPLLTEIGGALVRRLAWGALAVAFVGGAVYSSFLVLRDAPVGPPGHGAELRAFLPIVHGQPVLYAGQDRYAAYELLGADTHVPLVEFPDVDVSPNLEKPFDTGDAYSPIDFDSFSRSTLNRFPYVITGRAAWNSQAPPDFKRIAATPSYILWKRTGPPPEDRHVLLEGTEAAALADCAAPEIRILLARAGPRLALPAPWRRPETGLAAPAACSAPATSASQRPAPAGRPLEPLAPVLLPLRPDPQRAGLQRVAERRPSTASARTRSASPTTASSGRPGTIDSDGGNVRVHDHRRRRRPGSRASPATTARPRRRARRGPRRAAPDRAAEAGLRRLDRLVRIDRSSLNEAPSGDQTPWRPGAPG